jgi:RHS repeat-associated protein
MPTTRYTNIGGQIVAENRDGAYRFYGADPLGSTAALYDSTGTTTDTFTYWPYGEVRTSSGSTATPFKFCAGWGYYGDATGRLYVRARFYRDKLALWPSRDLLWPKESSYRYTRNRPLDKVDPSGLQMLSLLGTLLPSCYPYSPCEYARQKGMVPRSRGRVACCDGVREACAFMDDGLDWFNVCIEIHEEGHIAHDNCTCPPCGFGWCTVPTSEHSAVECRAHKQSLTCIEHAMRLNCPYGGYWCELEFQEKLDESCYAMEFLYNCRPLPDICDGRGWFDYMF